MVQLRSSRPIQESGIGQTETVTFTYRALDAHGVLLSITARSRLPYMGERPADGRGDKATTNEDQTVSINVLANDTDDFGPKIVTRSRSRRRAVQIIPANTANNQVVTTRGQFERLRSGQTRPRRSRTRSATTTADALPGPRPRSRLQESTTFRSPMSIRFIESNAARRSMPPTPWQSNGPGDDSVLVNDLDAEGTPCRQCG